MEKIDEIKKSLVKPFYFKFVRDYDCSAKIPWEFFLSAIRNTDKVDLWPHHLLRIYMTDEFKEDARIKVVYPLKGSLTFSNDYEVVSIGPGLQFKYAPVQPHPMQGEITIHAIEKEGGGCTFDWSGVYEASLLHPARHYFNLYFLDRVKPALRECFDEHVRGKKNATN